MYRLWLHYKVVGSKDLTISFKIPVLYENKETAEFDAHNYKCVPEVKGQGCLIFKTYTSNGKLIDTVHMIELSKYRISPYIVCFDTLYKKYIKTIGIGMQSKKAFLTLEKHTVEATE